MNTIPTQKENPNGLHQRYYIQKLIPNETIIMDTVLFDPANQYRRVPCDIGAEYFVLRLDDGGSDQKHIDACRKAVLTYAEEIKEHLPELSADLIKRYSLTLKSKPNKSNP